MYAPHPRSGTMLSGGVGRLYTCDGCGAEFAGTHKQAVDPSTGKVTAVYCRTCKPVGYEAPHTRVTAADLRRMAERVVPFEPAGERPAALTKTYGDTVHDPRWGDGEPRYPDEYDAQAQAEVRAHTRRRMTRL